MGGVGIKLRMGILHDAAKQQMLGPLSSHGWIASVVDESEDGEYLVIDAAKGEKKHSVALMYTSATDNRHYTHLDSRVSHIFTNGQLYHVESYARGITTPVSSLGDFFPLLVEWNSELAPAKPSKKIVNSPGATLRIVSENPLAGIWSRLNQFSSSELAKKLVLRRAQREGAVLADEQVDSKASGIAFALGNAADYYKGAPYESLNKRVLSLYYGTLSLAFAEMLAAPNGPSDLDQLEGMTKQGHGLFALSSVTGHFGDLKVGVLATGFYPNWANFLGYDITFYPKAKAKSVGDLDNSVKYPPQSFAGMSVLLSAVPELGDLFTQVYDDEPAWVIPYTDTASRRAQGDANTSSSYIFLKDQSKKISEARIALQDLPLAELKKFETKDDGEVFRARVDHHGLKYWHDALLLHKSPYLSNPTLIFPVLGGVPEYRVTSLAILYSLSILVRYMPSAWRRVEGGDWDQHLSVMRAVLDIFERILPQQFLESISGERVHTSLPGSLV
ncbi:hypothetical protein NS337_01350 [Pseudomonas oryzihabitans]|uniref:YaaC family protein n=1 Tax=Pseudomonas oryzihabitans TaxID=47885 RepID=UPI0007373832|nr:hypothetical protein [Pseudomonas psychrotolerans]KTT57308.1 hypothetical protein NS337_01350 [Pseudomonas psychrotolerans]